jgi:hypothetical protein
VDINLWARNRDVEKEGLEVENFFSSRLEKEGLEVENFESVFSAEFTFPSAFLVTM